MVRNDVILRAMGMLDASLIVSHIQTYWSISKCSYEIRRPLDNNRKSRKSHSHLDHLSRPEILIIIYQTAN